jgi:hypothetical protein
LLKEFYFDEWINFFLCFVFSNNNIYCLIEYSLFDPLYNSTFYHPICNVEEKFFFFFLFLFKRRNLTNMIERSVDVFFLRLP